MKARIMVDELKSQFCQNPPKKLETYGRNPIRKYFYQKTKNLTIKLLELQGSESILDVGCGKAFLINKIIKISPNKNSWD